MARKRDAKAKAYDPGDRIILDISQAEARALVVLFKRTGGCPITSPRKHTDAVMNALRKIDRSLGEADPARWGKTDGEGYYFYRDCDIAMNWPVPPYSSTRTI